MAALVVNTGLVVFLNQIRVGGSTESGSFKLRLYKSAKTPSAGDVIGDYTAIEANFNGYAAQTIVFPSAAAMVGAVASMTATAITWTKGVGGTGNDIYGWFLADAAGATLIAAGDDANAPIDMNTNGRTYTVTLTETLGAA